ncbi:GNAT family N-acetyltransferase [Aestuariimicrobium ganziense]|uniref:GNAT family N-acetyltransferase n=1 Tax=Aestuariimicrobium ganziense TaxID=2773677 RepID=UPI001943B9AA|nr:GNAT family N-acetyltransferase [Aestuariimicrobium ganziense]
MTDWTIRRARPEDAEGYADCQLASMEHAYAHFMPETFFVHLREGHDERISHYRGAIASSTAELEVGRTPSHDFWFATDPDGAILGMCTLARGMEEWEIRLGYPEPPVTRQLCQLYTLPRVHGSGLAQQLMDTALPPDEGAYLWVMKDNPRAHRFYQRNRFEFHGEVVPTGPIWHHKPMQRMWRPDAGSLEG